MPRPYRSGRLAPAAIFRARPDDSSEIIMWPWGVGLALAAAVAGGYALWLGVGKLRDLRARRASAPRSSPVPPQGTGTLLTRGEAAVARLREECASPTDPVLRDQISDFDDQAAAILV